MYVCLMGLFCRIKVKDLRFFSYHGFYPEEQILGNEYFVGVEIAFTPAFNGELENTINYEELYQLAKQEMAVPRQLLETVTYSILNKITSKYTQSEEVKISICKINPPFGGDAAKSEVELTWTRE